MLLQRDAVAAIVARCNLQDTAELRDRVRKYIAYLISERKLRINHEKKVRLGDATRLFSLNRKITDYRADLRDIMDVGPSIENSGSAKFESLTAVGYSFPEEREAIIKIAISLMERIVVLQRELEVCHAAAARRLSIAQQKTVGEELRLTLDDPFSRGPSTADLQRVLALPRLKKKIQPPR